MPKLNTKTVAASATSNVETKQPEISVDVNTLYKNTKQINTAIANAVKAGNAVQVEYQRIACSAIKHLEEHKDIRVIRHLLETLPEGMRRKSMSAFFDKFASVSFSQNEETGKTEVTYNKDKKSNLVAALTFAWWKAAVESQYVPFDLAVELAKLINRAESKLKKGVSSEKGDKVSAEQIAQLSALQMQLANSPVDEAQAA